MSGNAHDEARALADAEIEQQKQDERFHEGQENSHKALDSKDERSIANKLAREEARNEDDDAHLSKEDKLSKIDATAPARAHGNEPSRGAKIDQQIREEEEEELRRKGKA